MFNFDNSQLWYEKHTLSLIRLIQSLHHEEEFLNLKPEESWKESGCFLGNVTNSVLHKLHSSTFFKRLI